ncbi:MAG TPA: hypothetical protein VF472_26070 [Burkholderiaceae bacterium]
MYYAIKISNIFIEMTKFDFSVKTRDGSKIVSVVIAAVDRDEAERRLRQMYRDCEVLSCEIKQAEDRIRPSATLEDILSIISK